MPSLDETTNTIFATVKPPLGLLATIGCGRAARADLPPEDAAPFEALSAALAAWWPSKKRPLRDILEKELGACLDHYGKATNAQPLQLALDAAYHQMATAVALAPGSVRVHELGVDYVPSAESFTKLVRALAKQTRTDLELWKARMEHLLASAGTTEPWPALLEREGRMGWARPMQRATKLPKPLRELARLSDLGASSSWSMMGPKHALLLQLGTTKRTAVLDEEQRETLIEALPWLAG